LIYSLTTISISKTKLLIHYIDQKATTKQ